MTPIPITLKEANALVDQYHRHNKGTIGHRFSIGLEHEGKLVGCTIVGRPIARNLQSPTVAEVLRLCVTPEAPKNACSFLYRTAWRTWSAMGGKKLITYTLQTESGASLRGAGFKIASSISGGSWSRKDRKRETQPVQIQAKFRWELEVI